MNMTHRVQVNVVRDTGQKDSVLRSKRMRISRRFMKKLFGEKADVLVLVPGESVESVVIQEKRKEGETREAL